MTATNKTPEVGKDYRAVFANLPADCTMVYNGGISFTLTRADGGKMTRDSQSSYDAIVNRINEQTYAMVGKII